MIVERKVQGRTKREICGAGMRWGSKGQPLASFQYAAARIFQNGQEDLKKWKQSDSEPVSQVSMV